jgi:GGDEF domain-containing protein
MTKDAAPDSLGHNGWADPLFEASAALRHLDEGDRRPADRLVREWIRSQVRVTSNPGSALRYRWLTSTTLPASWPPYVDPRDSWRAWRPAEEEVRLRNTRQFEARLIEPIILGDSIELLERVATFPGSVAAHARVLLAEAMPSVRRDVAGYLAESHAWGDTWALWNLARRPRALARLHPFAFALADTYAERAIAAGSVGTGSRFPFHDKPLVSVAAQLATGLLALGFHPQLTGRLVAFVRSAEDPRGGWADADGPVDALTTLVAADLLLGLDPSWDSTGTAQAFARLRRPSGWWTAYGPETGWLTIEVERLLARMEEPFDRRFRWPQTAAQQRDRRTQLPFLGYLTDLQRLYAEIGSLGEATVEIAFLDLAGFGAWNNRFGMAAGDEVLRFLADELQRIPDSVAIRDGGDEFVIVGGPLGAGLADRITQFRTDFPTRFRERFGADALAVAPRIVTTTTTGQDVINARDQLGRDITRLKALHPSPDLTGVQAESGELQASPGGSGAAGLT